MIKAAQVNTAKELSAYQERQYTTAELDTLIDDYFDTIDVVSLDCFDTILWRHAATPQDVFYELQNYPLFKELGINAELRVIMEMKARSKKWISQQTSEVTLQDIYQHYSESLSQDVIHELIQLELGLEKKYCYSYQPILDLMEKAIAADKKIIIVSDTYLTEKELSSLLESKLPTTIFKHIQHIFVSSQYGVNKAQGLHTKVLLNLKLSGDKILHLGDHPISDLLSPAKYGIHSAQLLQFHPNVKDQQRMTHLGLTLVNHSVRKTEPLYEPYRSLHSKITYTDQPSAVTIGYHCLGPIYYSFARYLESEIQQLSTTHTNIKVLFLLRDAHLPKKIFDIICPHVENHAVRISRFTAYAASFYTRDDIIDYMSEVADSDNYKEIAKQLLFTESAINRLVKSISESDNKREFFVQSILKNESVEYIIKQSTLYRQRLMRYLEKSVNVKPGDTLLFVDLGYSGTTQSKLSQVFKTELNISIYGRYLLSLTTPAWKSSRAGLLDPSHCDEKLLRTLVAYIALLEQLSTTTDRSVVDFDEEGNPIYSDTSFNEDQYEKLIAVQSQCEQFAKDVSQSMETDTFHRQPEVMRQVVLAELTRLLYFPMADELHYLATFKFDLNLGTENLFALFDPTKGMDGLRRRGLFFMERNLTNMRTNYPAELRMQNISMLMTLLSQHRHGLYFKSKDISLLTESVPVYAIHGEQASTHVVEATATYDGYYSIAVPLGTGQYAVAAAFGQRYHWVQIYKAEIIPVQYLNTNMESLHTKEIDDRIIFDKMQHHGDGLYECLANEAMVFCQPKHEKDPIVLRISFRPTVLRAPTTEPSHDHP